VPLGSQKVTIPLYGHFRRLSRKKSARERSNSTVLVSQWYLLTALSSHPADLEIIIIKRSLNQVVWAQPCGKSVTAVCVELGVVDQTPKFEPNKFGGVGKKKRKKEEKGTAAPEQLTPSHAGPAVRY
jgi:hypothetical protein